MILVQSCKEDTFPNLSMQVTTFDTSRLLLWISMVPSYTRFLSTNRHNSETLQIFHTVSKHLKMTFSLQMTFIGETFQTLITKIRSLQNTLQVTNEWKTCPKHLKNFQGRLFTNFFFLKKIDFFRFFYDFRAFFEYFIKFRARRRARKCSNRRAIFKITKFRISEV